MILPETIPIFPLQDVVLFPSVFLPLHVFEPRYRDMVADALSGDRIIGMVLLKPGWETDYEGRPPVYGIGCAGLITHADLLSDGRYNIILKGLEKFRILGEDHRRSYRLATIEAIAEAPGPGDLKVVRERRAHLEALLVAGRELAGPERRVPTSIAEDELVNGLAQYLALEPLERQALLERQGLVERCQSLIELLEMKVFAAKRPWYTDEG